MIPIRVFALTFIVKALAHPLQKARHWISRNLLKLIVLACCNEHTCPVHFCFIVILDEICSKHAYNSQDSVRPLLTVQRGLQAAAVERNRAKTCICQTCCMVVCNILFLPSIVTVRFTMKRIFHGLEFLGLDKREKLLSRIHLKWETL